MSTNETDSISVSLSPEDKALFTGIAKDLGLTPSAAIRVFIRSFNKCGGYPFPICEDSFNKQSRQNNI